MTPPDPTELDLTTWLLAREGLIPWAGATRLKRLGDRGETGYRADTTLTLDRGRMRISGICTSERLDRSREIVRAKGLDVTDHKLNPILTIAHRWREPDGVIGRCEVNGEYTVRPGAENGRTPFTGQFFQSGPNAERAAQAFELVDSGVLRGVSVGFLIPPGGTQKVTADDGYPALDIIRSKLFEITILPVGDNPDAVVRVVEKGLGGRRLLPEFAAILQPYVPPPKTQVRGGWGRREKMMDMTGTAAADPAQQQPDPTLTAPAPVPPSAQFLGDLNTYKIGLLKFLKEQGGVQEHPAVKAMIPQLQMFLSQAFRVVANTYAQLQAEYPDIPTLPGAGSLLAAEPAPTPDAMMPADESGVAAGGPGDEGGNDLDFGDDFDESEDFGDGDDAPPTDEDESDDDERTKALKARRRYRAKVMQARSEAVLTAFWNHFDVRLGGTDAARLKGLDELIAGLLKSDAVPAPLRKAARQLAPYVREKALAAGNQLREKAAPAADEVFDTDAVAAAVKVQLDAALKPIKDTLFQATGKGSD